MKIKKITKEGARRILGFTLLIISIVFSSAPIFAAGEEIPTVHFNVSEFVVTGDNPLSDEETQKVLSVFLGEHEGLDGLTEAAAELQNAMAKAGYSFHRVILPPQTLEQGRVKLEVVEFKVANIDVTGNHYFSPENIKSSLPRLVSGETPDTSELSRELIIANEHPAKDVTLRIKTSKVPDSVDAELAVKDRRPWQLFAVLNNIGTDETGDYRLSAGVQHSNLFGKDHSLTFSYTTSPDHAGEVKQFGANYRMPLYSMYGSLSIYYSRSDVNSGVIEQVFDVSGAGDFFGVNYTQIFPNIGNYRHRAVLGVEDKLFENDITFQNTPIGVDVRSRPLTVSYGGEWKLEQANVRFQLSYTHNLGGGSRNNDSVYAMARSGADRHWQAFRFTANANYFFSNRWLLSAGMNGQWTDEPLISGEQFGLGGVNSVRGFEERAIIGDRGIRLSLQAWTPPWKYNIRFVGFVEGGYARTLEAPAGQIESETIASLGVGFRWNYSDKLSTSLDYAHEINDARVSNAGGSRVHFNIYFRY